MSDLKMCRNCLFNKNINEFYENKNQCKNCYSSIVNEYYQGNRKEIIEKIIKYQNHKYQSDPQYRFRKTISSNIRNSLKGTKSELTEKYLGIDIAMFKKWIQFQFKDGMTWENQGIYWHIDHVIPVSSFNFNNEEDRYQCNNWINLRSLEAKENLRKHDKIDGNLFIFQSIKVELFKLINNIGSVYYLSLSEDENNEN